MLKQCSQCQRWLSEDQFYPRRGGLRSGCKQCHGRYYKENKEKLKAWRLQRKYGITLEQRTDLLELQGGRCAICKRTDPGPTDWVVDHDHQCCPTEFTCGACIRGILCSPCNLKLGHLGDDTELIGRMIDYLKGTRT